MSVPCPASVPLGLLVTLGFTGVMPPQGQTLLVLLPTQLVFPADSFSSCPPLFLSPFLPTGAKHPLSVALSVTNTNIPTLEMQPVS